MDIEDKEETEFIDRNEEEEEKMTNNIDNNNKSDTDEIRCTAEKIMMKECPSIILTDQEKVEIYELLKGKYLNKNPTPIYNCLNGKTKTAYGYKWKYKKNP